MPRVMDKDQLNSWNQRVIEEFRANNGVVGGDFEGKPVLLLHTMGAKSGKERINPLVFSRDGDRIVDAEDGCVLDREDFDEIEDRGMHGDRCC